MMKTMVIEPVRAFNGLDVLVARDEGLFAAAGLDLQFARPQTNDLRSTAEGTLANPVTNQGVSSNVAKPACSRGERVGNNRRVAASSVGARQVGRRAMVCGALVPPWSSVYTPQDSPTGWWPWISAMARRTPACKCSRGLCRARLYA